MAVVRKEVEMGRERRKEEKKRENDRRHMTVRGKTRERRNKGEEGAEGEEKR